MKSFSAYTSKPLSEGYNIFPKNEKELSNAIKDRSPEIQKEIKSLYTFLKKSHELPINLNAKIKYYTKVAGAHLIEKRKYLKSVKEFSLIYYI